MPVFSTVVGLEVGSSSFSSALKESNRRNRSDDTANTVSTRDFYRVR